MNTALRILHLEDDVADAHLVNNAIQEEGLEARITVIADRPDFLATLKRDNHDLVLADYHLPGFDGLEALMLWRDQWPAKPFIFVTGLMGEDLAVESLRSGATDYVLKDNLARLVPAIHRAVKEAETQTRRLRAEVALMTSLREKEVLLREIHHRVKNNLQVISSLVSLQAATSADPAFQAMFQDVRDRVRTMSLVHEKLYESESLAEVNFAEYTRSLLDYLWRMHGHNANGIRLNLDLKPVKLSMDVAVPCGLLLNEVATNALKHAFRGRSEGVVTVALHDGPDELVHLSIHDDGVGLPATLDWRQSRSLGLQLVQMLAGQLNGTVEVARNGGTQFQISFEPKLSSDDRNGTTTKPTHNQ